MEGEQDAPRAESTPEKNDDEITTLVQSYEKKIGIYETTLDLFKQKFSELNQKYNDLTIDNMIKSENIESMREESECVRQMNDNLQHQLSSANSKYKLETNKVTQLTSQLNDVTDKCIKQQEIFKFLEIDHAEVMKYMMKNTSNDRWVLSVKNEDPNKEVSEKETLNAEDQQNNQETTEQPEKPEISDPAEKTTSEIPEISLNTQYQETKNLDEDSPNVTESKEKLNEKSKQSFDPMKIRIYPNRESIPRLPLDEGIYLFVPSYDYTRFKEYIFSEDFKWSNKGFTTVKYPFSTNTTTIKDEMILKLQSEMLSINTVKYATLKQVPPVQPIDGSYIFFENHSLEEPTSFLKVNNDNMKVYSKYSDLKETMKKFGWYQFVPNSQYFFLNGQHPMPNEFKNHLPKSLDSKEFESNKNIPWAFRIISYSRLKDIPKNQPIKGFYIFQKHSKDLHSDLPNSNNLLYRTSIVSDEEFFSLLNTDYSVSNKSSIPASDLTEDTQRQISENSVSSLSMVNNRDDTQTDKKSASNIESDEQIDKLENSQIVKTDSGDVIAHRRRSSGRGNSPANAPENRTTRRKFPQTKNSKRQKVNLG